MANSGASKSTKGKWLKKQNQVETLNDVKNNDLFDKFFGNYPSERQVDEDFVKSFEAGKSQRRQRQEFSIFNYQNYYETEIVKKEIGQLTEQIKKEIELIKKSDSALMQEVKEVQKLTIEQLPDRPGIYHIRFFEIILSLLRTIRAKIGESRTWLQAMVSKKKKRGSLFAVRSKQKGTMYSLSQELQSARSIQ